MIQSQTYIHISYKTTKMGGLKLLLLLSSLDFKGVSLPRIARFHLGAEHRFNLLNCTPQTIIQIYFNTRMTTESVTLETRAKKTLYLTTLSERETFNIARWWFHSLCLSCSSQTLKHKDYHTYLRKSSSDSKNRCPVADGSKEACIVAELLSTRQFSLHFPTN